MTSAQMLEQGAAAHNAGNVQEAERLYRAILEVHPKDPDANHNLGLIAVFANKADEALPLFETALEANPKIEQFWLSYIDALIKEQQFDNAKQVIQQGKQQGVAEEKLNTFESQLPPKTQIAKSDISSPSQQQLNNLLEYYQIGQYGDAESLALSITREFPKHQFGWKVLGALLGQTGRRSEAVNANQEAVLISPQDAEAHNNLGITLQQLGRLKEAEASYIQAIVLKPDFAESHYNLGIALNELGRLDEAQASYMQAIVLKSDFAESHYNLGITLKELGRLEESEASYTQAIALKPDYAEAHNNLGITLQELSRLEESEASFTQAIELKPDYAEAHYNLGITLQELGRLEECEASCTQAIALKSDYSEAHSLLGCIMHENGDLDSALNCFKKAFNLDSNLRTSELRFLVLKSRITHGRALGNSDTLSKVDSDSRLSSNPLILSRVVEKELVEKLYEMTSRTLINTPDSRFGNGSCSLNFTLFEDESSIIKTVSSDLTRILSDAVKSKVYVYDSFFNILGPRGGSLRHNHLESYDKPMDLWKQKYSLVYYLSVGDQDCSEPGFLKLYKPDEDILPSEGMMVIVPATRLHSAIYGGKTDRVMIGVNFYAF